jgi:hypothetical protein
MYGPLSKFGGATLKPLALCFKGKRSTPTTFFSFFPSSYEGVHFSHNLKHHLKFQKLAKLMETTKNKILRNVHIK